MYCISVVSNLHLSLTLEFLCASHEKLTHLSVVGGELKNIFRSWFEARKNSWEIFTCFVYTKNWSWQEKVHEPNIQTWWGFWLYSFCFFQHIPWGGYRETAAFFQVFRFEYNPAYIWVLTLFQASWIFRSSLRPINSLRFRICIWYLASGNDYLR